jgi:hypothetical protein
MLFESLLICTTLIGTIKAYRQLQKLKNDSRFLEYLPKKSTLQTLKETVLIPLTGGKVRRQQLKQIATGKEEHEPNVHQKINKDLRFPIGLFGLSLIGAWWYPPLQLLSVTICSRCILLLFVHF